MAHAPQETGNARPKGRTRRALRAGFRVAVIVVLVALVVMWLRREEIADNFIADTFSDRGIPATYDVEQISARRQVLTNVVIGDPQRPDLTVERIEVRIAPRLGLPDIREVRLTRPRLFGTYRDGQASFGALDSFIFTGSDAPFEFPAMRLAVDDGRALMETDYGRVGMKLSGSGHLRGGFEGELAVAAPELAIGDCAADGATLYGRIAIDAERPEFRGPVRFAALDCEGSGLAVRDAGVQLDLQAERNLVEYEGDLDFAAGSVAVADMQAALRGDGRFTWRDGDLNVRYDVAAAEAETPWATIGSLEMEGRIRALDNFAQAEVEGEIAGEDLRMGPEVNDAIADAADATQGTLLAPLLNRIGLNLARDLRGSELAATFNARQRDGRASLTIPDARLRGGSDETLLALSRGQVVTGEGGLPRFSGNFQTGGAGLPRIAGRMEQTPGGALELRMTMREYTAGGASLALSDMRLLQGRGGELALNGRALASGDIPGGTVSGLVLPIDATLSADGSLSLWRGCRDVRFDRLTVANLRLGRESLTLCPPSGRPILRSGSAGLQFAAGVNALDLRGEFAETPIAVRSGPLGVAWPGALSASNLDIRLGPQGSAQRFTVTDLRAQLSADNIGGDFAGADVLLASVPLDIRDASGTWTYADDRLSITEGALRVEDREEVDRFEPLVARDASLSLFDNLITADAVLREPVLDRPVTRVRIAHDLATSAGHADLIVEELIFDDTFQPAPSYSQCRNGAAPELRPRGLTCLALGIVSDVQGSVSGTGRIDWDAEGVMSSGTFSTDGVDVAAPFGPVKGARGTIEFTDLLGLTTAPDQRLAIDAVNPGIEIYDGVVTYRISGGELLQLGGGTWPFMGGTLTMRPVDIRFGASEVRSYIMVIEGLEASQFVQNMELGNLAANGVFDGVVPIIFDENGNGRLENGVLTSRPPGGNVAYIGELTYEDMGFFANYAFSALRDLKYDRMEIYMDGPLTGELVTRVRFDGIGQGETAQSNFITRAVADLPIELRINIRAPFYQLITSLRSLYDPSAVRDPRSIGLVTEEGVRLQVSVNQQAVDERDAAAEAEEERLLREALEPDDPDIQPQESEPVP
ncbi:intermembrane phospholipid transport protein YdbH family protein [Aurantiacibacter odishensis]|uniref:intermembrane phospholipid transport protein YdbH family protein n=1 Tax=Aurantiacibacter odishensis TaxID=1155476 RepID=UPI000E7309CB|nr:YdbH domain-containing protein [Aurantiacibacter odishensis]